MALAIKAQNISKAYQLGEIGTGTLSRDLERWFAKVRGKEDPFLTVGETNDRTSKGSSDVVWSLRDVNFEIEEGDAVGIIGRNGAGKSTLLKLLSRVTSPTTGEIDIKGRIASLLEVGTGFHPELTGRENIFLNGAILGMRKKEIKRKFDEIVDFAGVERYIDTPVKRYSSGMYVRLAFAVAAYLESEILIVDEVLAVGDAEFQKKCLGKMGDVSKGEGRTVLFVSHNMLAVQSLCTKGIILKNGYNYFQGNVQDAVLKYGQLQNSQIGTTLESRSRYGNGSIRFAGIEVTDNNGNLVSSVESGASFQVLLTYIVTDPEYDFTGSHVSLSIQDQYGTSLFNHHNLLVNQIFENNHLKTSSQFIVDIKNFPLAAGSYLIGINIFQHYTPIDVIDNAFELEVVGSNAFNYKNSPDPKHGLVLIEADWQLK
jgi:lipopolysaccharide transport system ATP-binding protein